VKGRARLDRSLALERADPQLLGDRDLANGAGGADLAAQRAVELAPAHLGDHDRRPEALEARFEHGRLKNIRRANPDALVALDATAKKLVLGDRTGWTDRAAAEVLLHPAGCPRHREEEKAKECCQVQFTAANGRIGDLAGLAWQKPERK